MTVCVLLLSSSGEHRETVVSPPTPFSRRRNQGRPFRYHVTCKDETASYTPRRMRRTDAQCWLHRATASDAARHRTDADRPTYMCVFVWAVRKFPGSLCTYHAPPTNSPQQVGCSFDSPHKQLTFSLSTISLDTTVLQTVTNY